MKVIDPMSCDVKVIDRNQPIQQAARLIINDIAVRAISAAVGKGAMSN